MTARAARRAARIAWHRRAHLEVPGGGLPDHKPEGCELDIDPGRLDVILEAVTPILRRHAVQEFARRHGRRQLQLTPAEVSALRRAIEDRRIGLGDDTGRNAMQQRLALARVLAKFDALPE